MTLQTQSALPVSPDKILVAIPALNEERHIANTLRGLMSDREEMNRVKIVVADGGSSDKTRAIVQNLTRQHANIHLIDNPAQIQAAGVNKIVSDCAEPQHEILVRVDAHAKYPDGYVLNVAHSLSTRDTSALATVMDSQGDSCFQRGAAWAMETKLGSGGSGHRGGQRSGYVDHGHHAGFRLDMWRKVGGYDTQFIANEDAELDHRIRLAGGRIWLDADIRLGYVMRSTPWKLAVQYSRYGAGRAQNLIRHGMQPKARQMIPPAVFLLNIAGLGMSVFAPPALMIPCLYLMLTGAAAICLVWKKNSLCAVCAAPALWVMHHSWAAGFLWKVAEYVLRRGGTPP